MKICVVGCGYVGLTCGVCLARLGHQVVGLDTDRERIESLRNAIPPIHEPYLDDFLIEAGTSISFTANPAAVTDSNLIFITVPTPAPPDGRWDLSHVEAAFRNIGTHLRGGSGYKLIVNKCTTPVGTTVRMAELLTDMGVPSSQFDVLANPEFLTQNSAIRDFLHPHRIVIGSGSESATSLLLDLYRPIIERDLPFDAPTRPSREDGPIPVMTTDPATAEMMKYASNAFLATKISFINEIGNICKTLGVDVHEVAAAMGLDPRISPHFLEAGGGFGGSCLPKDTRALVCMARDLGYEPQLLEAVLDVNKRQPLRMIEMAAARLGGLSGKRVAILGVAFKPNTDDIRESLAVPIVEGLLQAGAVPTLYDPKALGRIRGVFDEKVLYATDAKGAVADSDCVLILTAWDEFKDEELLRGRFVIDARRTIRRDENENWEYLC